MLSVMCVCHSAYYYPQCHWSVTFGPSYPPLPTPPPPPVALTCSDLFIGPHHAGTPPHPTDCKVGSWPLTEKLIVERIISGMSISPVNNI